MCAVSVLVNWCFSFPSLCFNGEVAGVVPFKAVYLPLIMLRFPLVFFEFVSVNYLSLSLVVVVYQSYCVKY